MTETATRRSHASARIPQTEAGGVALKYVNPSSACLSLFCCFQGNLSVMNVPMCSQEILSIHSSLQTDSRPASFRRHSSKFL